MLVVGGMGGPSARWQHFESINSSSNALAKPLVDFTMVGHVRMQPQGSLASVLRGTSAMVNITPQKEGHSLDFVAKSTKSSPFGAKSTKSRFEVATVHRNVDYRVSVHQSGGKGPKWVQLTACDPPHIDQQGGMAYSLLAISASWMGGSSPAQAAY